MTDKRPPKSLLDRVTDAILGPDEDETMDEAVEQDEAVGGKVVSLVRKPDYTVEVTYDKSTGLFGAVMRTKTSVVPMDSQGSTPGEALAYAGAVLDASLVRRGFGKE